MRNKIEKKKKVITVSIKRTSLEKKTTNNKNPHKERPTKQGTYLEANLKVYTLIS